MRKDIKPGAQFPDYELPDNLGKKRKLSFFQGNDPMILTLNRGGFCPKDHVQLTEFAEFAKKCLVGKAKPSWLPSRPKACLRAMNSAKW